VNYTVMACGDLAYRIYSKLH